MMKKILLGALLGLVSISVSAEVVRFTKGQTGSWQVGDKSQMYHTNDGKLGIQMIVKSSTIKGKAYYVVGFQSKTGGQVTFGARVTDRNPSDTHFTGRAAPGKNYVWGDHLPAGLNTVYVLVKPQK